jgi:hypothetical protein
LLVTIVAFRALSVVVSSGGHGYSYNVEQGLGIQKPFVLSVLLFSHK